MIKSIYFLFLLPLLLQSCALSDLRTQEIIDNKASNSKAIKLLQNLVARQGFANIDSNSTYEVTVKDHWKGFMGKMANGWDWNDDAFKMFFTTQNFNGQVEVVEGNKKGFIAGLQNWNYYEKRDNHFDNKIKVNKGVSFMLAAFHYFFEIGPRMLEAPFIRYMGKDLLFNEPVDKVFVSWGNEKTKDYDQYILWINQLTGLVDAVTYTVREKYMMSPNNIVATIRFTDYKNIDEVFIPFTQTIQMNQPHKDLEKYIHRLSIQEFKWNSFKASKLSPFENLDSKEKQ